MRFRLGKMALAGILAVGVSATETRPASAGDGFARVLVQQARQREQTRLRNQRRDRGQPNRVVTAAPPTSIRVRPGLAAGNILPVARPRTAPAVPVTRIVTSAPAPGQSYAPSGTYYYGGYYYAAPQPAPLYYGRYIDPAPVRSHAPSRGSIMRNRVASSYDPTGRHDGLARPWLK